MSEPKRIQRQRTKGWRMPEGAVYVGMKPLSMAVCEATAKRLDDFVPGPREQQQMFAGVQL